MKVIGVSKYTYNLLKQEHCNSSIQYFGDISVSNESYINEIKNITLSQEIYEFTEDVLLSNQFNTKQHLTNIFEINKQFLLNTNKKTLRKLKHKVQYNPFQLNLDCQSISTIEDINNYYCSDFCIQYFDTLLQYNYNGIGKGELFFGLLTNLQNSIKLGDLMCNNFHIELKGDYSRFKHVNGYGSTKQAWKIYKELLTKLSSEFNITCNTNDANNWNFNTKNIDNILNNHKQIVIHSDIIKLKELYKTVLLILYNECPIELLEKFINNIFNNIHNITGEEFLELFLILQFEYYKYLTKFDYMILLNSTHYLIIKNVVDLKDKIKYINYSSFSWKEDRNCVYSISLKKIN